MHIYGVYELAFQCEDKSHDLDLKYQLLVDFTGPSGKHRSIPAYWNGGKTWYVRFSPDEPGIWNWQSRCIDALDNGLLRTGSLECLEYSGNNPLYLHGPLSVSSSGTHLVHADGKPFFWLGDTAWSGVIRGDDANWKEYLQYRRTQLFTVIQFVASNWRGAENDEAGEQAYSSVNPLRINPEFFNRIDARVKMINDHDMICAPVILWAAKESDTGNILSEEDATALAMYIYARYDAYQTVWIPAGDGKYEGPKLEQWKRLCRKLFGFGHSRLATIHPCGLNWVGEDFHDEPWFSFNGYQSGHIDAQKDLTWHIQGPPALEWNNNPVKPVINLEPNYETASGYANKTYFTDYHVRRAAYWSLMIGPPAGLTYGHDSIWNWNLETGPSEGHGDWHKGNVPPWYTGLKSNGISSMTAMYRIFENFDWTNMSPAPELLGAQPGTDSPERYISAAALNQDGTALFYSPCGNDIIIDENADISGPVILVDPATGIAFKLSDDVPEQITLPDSRDWLVVCGPGYDINNR